MYSKERMYQEILEYLNSDNNFLDLHEYELVNNYGVKFNFKGASYDLRHQVNVYGVRVNNLILSGHNKTVYIKSSDDFISIFAI